MGKGLLKTERLILRKFSIKDADDIFEIVSDRDTCYDDGGYEPFKEKNNEFNELMKKISDEENRFIIEAKGTCKVIGLIHLMKIEERAVSSYEIGYIINKNYRRKGYASEAVEKILQYCFEEENIEVITASVFETNVKSAKMLEKLGFIKTGGPPKSIKHCRDGLIDMIGYYKKNNLIK